MDTLTHTVLGACLGEAIAGKKLGKKAMLIGAMANNLPDIDVVSGLWTSQAQGLLVHRGITHSILFAVVMTPLLAYVFQKTIKNNSLPFKGWLFLIGSGLFLHIIMDAFTAYGTGWFEPFNPARVSFNTLFILDPFFLLPLLIGAIALLILKKESFQKRKRINTIVLILSCVYLLSCIWIKISINKFIERDLALKHISYSDYLATPTPMNNLLWYTVVKNKSDYYIGYRSVFDKSESITWEYISKNDSLLIPFKKSEEVKKLMQFSKNYYSLSKPDSSVIFSDMRFGQIGGWYIKNAPFVFNFNIERTAGNATNLQQGRYKSFNSKEFTLLIDRIKGNETLKK